MSNIKFIHRYGKLFNKKHNGSFLQSSSSLLVSSSLLCLETPSTHLYSSKMTKQPKKFVSTTTTTMMMMTTTPKINGILDRNGYLIKNILSKDLNKMNRNDKIVKNLYSTAATATLESSDSEPESDIMTRQKGSSNLNKNVDGIMPLEKIRNIAIIAHVDHGKTTLVDCLLKQSETEVLDKSSNVSRVMDSNELEKERGITILSKVTSIDYQNHRINIVDTPGHADFGGEVERILNMVDGVVLVVDATEGPMAQTKFVLSKALSLGLKPIVVFNKVDRPTSRIEEVDSELLDLFASLEASDEQMEYPIIYASAKEGWAIEDPTSQERKDMEPLFKTILSYVQAPALKENRSKPFSMLVTQIEPNAYVGKCFLGRVHSGNITMGDKIVALDPEGNFIDEGKVMKIFHRQGLRQVDMEVAAAGDIISVAGLSKAGVNSTICDPQITTPINSIPIDPPTISMSFAVNDSPLSGQEGKYVTSTVIRERLLKECETNVALAIDIADENCELKGRGELQLGILLETMRREGYEVAVSPPKVVLKKDESGSIIEPIEEVTVDVDSKYSGVVIEKLSQRKGDLKEMIEYGENAEKSRLFFDMPTRGLLGYFGEFKNDTHGTGVLNHIFNRYETYRGKIERSRKGSLISSASGNTTAYALQGLEPRGVLFIGPNAAVYPGMVIGEHARENDLDVNPVKAKAISNVRSVSKEDAIKLSPPKAMTLEEIIAYVQEDEIIEVTPKSVRLRKRELDANKRATMKRKEKAINQK